MFFCNRVNFVYEPAIIFRKDEQWTYAREPLLRRMPDGTLVCFHYAGGKREPSPDNVALITRSRDDGVTWSNPEVMCRHDSRCVWPSELFTDTQRPFVAIHTFQYHGHYTELRAFRSFTDDNGKTWSEPESFKGTPPNFSVRQGKVLSNGNIIFAIYWEEQEGHFNWPSGDKFNSFPDWKFRSGVIRSTDNGATWTKHGYLTAPTNLWEPELIELENGHLLMLIRCCGAGVLYRSESFDYGVTWSPAKPSDIPNPSTKLVMFKINGKIVLVSNMDKNRRQLSLWVSADNGKTWPTQKLLAEVPDEVPGVEDIDEHFNQIPWICYPHGFADDEQQLLYLATDSIDMHYLIKVPFADFI